VTSQLLTQKLVKNKVTMSDNVSAVANKNYRRVSNGISLSELGRVLGNRHQFVLVEDKYICSNFDLLNFINMKQQ
jgi:hypothetical protein